MRRFKFALPVVFALGVAGCPSQSGSDGVVSGDTDGSTNSSGDTVTAGAVATAGDATSVNTSTGPSENPSPSSDPFEGQNAALAAQVLDLVNAERTAAGLPELTHNALLSDAAAVHAADMASNDFFAHTGSDGSDIGLRVDRVGYDWGFVGENIAFGPTDAAVVMDLWMNSEGHRANILNTHFSEIGIAIDMSGATPYWVQDFGHLR